MKLVFPDQLSFTWTYPHVYMCELIDWCIYIFRPVLNDVTRRYNKEHACMVKHYRFISKHISTQLNKMSFKRTFMKCCSPTRGCGSMRMCMVGGGVAKVGYWMGTQSQVHEVQSNMWLLYDKMDPLCTLHTTNFRPTFCYPYIKALFNYIFLIFSNKMALSALIAHNDNCINKTYSC